jgi:hypothetical protein
MNGKMHEKFWSEIQKGRFYMGDTGVGWRIILK